MDDNKQENLKIKKVEEENVVKAEEVKPAAQPTHSTEPKKENVLEIKVNNESVHNESLNINKNLGSFENSFNPSKDPIKQIDDEIVINEDSNRLGSLREEDKKVDFAKFSRTKRKQRHAYKPGTNNFAIKIDTWLRNDRSMHIIWIFAASIIAIILSISIAFLTVICLDQANAAGQGYWNLDSFKAAALASKTFSGLAIAVVVLPLVYLLITVLVGINNTYRSRQFHYFLWISLIAGFVFTVVTIPLGSYVIILNNNFTPTSHSQVSALLNWLIK